MVEQQQAGRLAGGDLPGDLAADRATGAGDHDAPARQQRADHVEVRGDLHPAEQVVDLQVADVLEGDGVTDQLGARRDDAQRDARGPADLGQQADDLLRRVADRQDRLLSLHLLGQASQVPHGPQDRDAVHPAPVLALVVVEEPHRERAGVGVVEHVGDQRRSGRTRTEHEDAGAGRGSPPAPVGEQAALEAQQALHAGADDQREPDGAERVLHRQHERQPEQQPEADHGGDDDLSGLVDAGVLPHAAVEAACGADGDDDDRGDGQEEDQVGPDAARDGAAAGQDRDERERDHDAERVEDHEAGVAAQLRRPGGQCAAASRATDPHASLSSVRASSPRRLNEPTRPRDAAPIRAAAAAPGR